MSILDLNRDTRSDAMQQFSGAWDRPRNAYRVHVAICPDEDGGFYAYALTIPGVASQGEDAVEALANIREAATEAIAAYVESGERVPHVVDEEERPRGCIERWITVNV